MEGERRIRSKHLIRAGACRPLRPVRRNQADRAAAEDVPPRAEHAEIGRRGPGLFTVPGLMKIRIKRKPATKARKGVNPFTGETMMFKAKPARNVVKITALKALKDMV